MRLQCRQCKQRSAYNRRAMRRRLCPAAVVGVGDAARVVTPVVLSQMQQRRLTAAVRQRRPRRAEHVVRVVVTRSSHLFAHVRRSDHSSSRDDNGSHFLTRDPRDP